MGNFFVCKSTASLASETLVLPFLNLCTYLSNPRKLLCVVLPILSMSKFTVVHAQRTHVTYTTHRSRPKRLPRPSSINYARRAGQENKGGKHNRLSHLRTTFRPILSSPIKEGSLSSCVLVPRRPLASRNWKN